MPILDGELRNILEKAVIEAREVAEASARSVLTVLAVDQKEAPAAMSPEQRHLRNSLRAKARQLGGGLMIGGISLLLEEIAYQQWHRMLFARFLAENSLLVHPTEGVPVTLHDCAELASEEGEPDLWGVAAKYANMMLPGIFASDDPSVQVRFAPEGRLKLESILTNLPLSIFTSDDGLGWIYQFWQSRRKDEVNSSGKKIGGADLAPVTQLFTEDYIVRFLLENSLGAWWTARHPDSPIVKTFAYLRFKENGKPAVGSFSGWPSKVAEVAVMDPCCGSGHFLVAAFNMLRRMRMEEEGISEVEAADAVIRDNLFGLEIDERCVQIATFALAFAAWKVGGYRDIPLPNVACTGIAVQGQLDTWAKLANGDENLRHTLHRLYSLFSMAPDLGSLINPTQVPVADRMFAPDYDQVAPILEKALAKERNQDDPVAAVFGLAAQGVARAAGYLSRQYTLVATNVPYLGFKKQHETIKRFCEQNNPQAKMDLATVFLERCRAFTVREGTYAVLTPQNWLFLGSYEGLRKKLLNEQEWQHVCWLGPGAFETVSGEVVKPAMVILSNRPASPGATFTGLDASELKTVSAKNTHLRKAPLEIIDQRQQLRNPDARILIGATTKAPLLSEYALSPRGIVTGDNERWVRCFWEFPYLPAGWRFFQEPAAKDQAFTGREHVINWIDKGKGMLRPGLGNPAYGRDGVGVNRMSQLACTMYTGELYDQGIAVIVPKEHKNLSAIWMFCQSPEFDAAIRRLDKKLGVTPATLLKVPFDLPHWQGVASRAGPMPEPHSNHPTQWLFDGNVLHTTEPLQVAVARLLGYRWPKQEPDLLDNYADRDGIVSLVPVVGEQSAAEHLRAFLAAAYGEQWSLKKQDELLALVGFGVKDLSEWIRDGFFVQHCRIFHNRPFIWHIWDGRKDGFSALVNYHRFDSTKLDKLIYTYLGAWIKQQREKSDAKEAGAEGRLVAALELQKRLEKIREGKSPFDIYIRWKSLDEQPIGWNPDLNDGVRLNIRPFVEAGVLRSKFVINWNKDRGKNLDGSERINDRHLTIAEKLAAQGSAKGKN